MHFDSTVCVFIKRITDYKIHFDASFIEPQNSRIAMGLAHKTVQ